MTLNIFVTIGSWISDFFEIIKNVALKYNRNPIFLGGVLVAILVIGGVVYNALHKD